MIPNGFNIAVISNQYINMKLMHTLECYFFIDLLAINAGLYLWTEMLWL